MADSFPAYVVRKDEQGQVTATVESLQIDALPEGEVLIRAAYSSLNYKDALAATGHPGVVRRFPHVPGIDVAGTVAQSTADAFAVGDQVLVTGYSLGETHWGGYAGYVRVPAAWVVPLPAGLSPMEAMTYGTAGFTAAQSVLAITERNIDPARGPVVVTGATGGVGSLSVGLLAKAGYEVVAVTGKPEAEALLNQLGAARVVSRDEVNDTSGKPLLSVRWSAAVDTVGGNPLSTILRSLDHRGVVAACGLVAGVEIPITVYPFILRGVNLVGIDSANCPMESRRAIWERLAGVWKLDELETLATTVNLAQLGGKVQEILAGKITGRVVVEPTAGP